MPDWTYNKLTVSGDKEAVAAFRPVVAGTTETGDPKPLSLNVIDPMPPEYEDRETSWGDSEEFAAIQAEFKTLAEEERMPFLNANPGFKLELMERAVGHDSDDGWYNWRVQHWGTKWELSDEVTVEEAADGTEVTYDFDTAWSDIAPAVATAARRFPDLSFTLISQDEHQEDEETVRTWREGQELPSRTQPSPRERLD
jgi:hypothetical protein